MFLKKIEGIRSVTLPDGNILTQADLPPVRTTRWVASRKIAVVRGVLYGLITKEQALRRYGLSQEEFQGWVTSAAIHGQDGLKTTNVQKIRQ
jgi:hypothetical protein